VARLSDLHYIRLYGQLVRVDTVLNSQRRKSTLIDCPVSGSVTGQWRDTPPRTAGHGSQPAPPTPRVPASPAVKPSYRVSLERSALAGRADVRDNQAPERLPLGPAGQGMASRRPPQELRCASPGAEPHNVCTRPGKSCPGLPRGRATPEQPGCRSTPGAEIVTHLRRVPNVCLSGADASPRGAVCPGPSTTGGVDCAALSRR
jgi:hypothetical protein